MSSKHKDQDHYFRNGIQIIKAIIIRHIKDDQDRVHACKRLESLETEYNDLVKQHKNIKNLLDKWEGEDEVIP